MIKLTKQQENILEGLMLGDGCIRRRKITWNASLRVQRAQKDLAYLEYHAKIFHNLITKRGITLKDRIDSRNGKIYPNCSFETSANKGILNDIHARYYPVNGVKIVPKDLVLNGEIMATWFCDDGWISKSNNNYFDIGLATHGFIKSDVEFLISLLEERYKENFNISSEDDDAQYTIHASDYAAREMIADMKADFPEGMERKRLWKDVLVHPPKKFSIKLSSEKRRQQVQEFLDLNDEFYQVDLPKYLDWKINRTDGRKEWNTQNAIRYLQPYIKSGKLIEIGRNDADGSPKGIKYKRIK